MTTPDPETGTGSKPTPDAVQNPQLARWQRFRNSRNTALASEHGWLTLTSFQWLEDRAGRRRARPRALVHRRHRRRSSPPPRPTV